MEKSTLYLFGIVLLIGIGAYFFFNNGETVNGSIIQEVDAGEQKIVISEKDYNYYPNEIKVKAGQPVSISLDEKVKGCLRAFTIRDLGISKNLKTPQDTVTFTPTKKGSFRFTCSMGMGYGTFIVE
ncbi:MAG: cupredoxin domain-containing protein [Nanoarchaeota archaeon]